MHPSLSARTWQAFQAATTTLGPTPGLRARWHDGRTRFAVWVLRVDGPEVRGRAAQLQRALAPWIHPTPLADLHITVRVAGFLSPRSVPDPAFPAPDHVDAATLDTTLHRLRGARTRVQIGRANSFTSAPFLEVRDPLGDLSRLRQCLQAAGADEARTTPWLPHVTVGTWRRSMPTGDPRRCLTRHRIWRDRWPREARLGLALIDPETSTMRSFQTCSVT